MEDLKTCAKYLMMAFSKSSQPQPKAVGARASCVRSLVILMMSEMILLVLLVIAFNDDVNCKPDNCKVLISMDSLYVFEGMMGALIFLVVFQLFEVLALLSRRLVLVFPFMAINALMVILYSHQSIRAYATSFIVSLAMLHLAFTHLVLLVRELLFCREVVRKPAPKVIV